MQGRSPQPFGRRNRIVTTAPVIRPSSPSVVDDPHRAFFAAARAETETTVPGGIVEVPRSLRAGVLAGIVVACGLASLDATEKIAMARRVGDAMPGHAEVQLLVPALMLFAVLGGGRSAATSLLVAHGALARLRQTSHLAYALAGGAAAALFAAVLLLLLGQAPEHGIAIDILAGVAGGFFYRVFAGTRRVASGASP